LVSIKSLAKPFLQRVFGFHAYLVAHSIFVIATMRFRAVEGDVRHFIDRLGPDAVVLDIGANVGAMSVLFSRRCPRGTVYAFEPIHENIRAARSVLDLFRAKNVVLFPIGLSDRARTLTMIMPTTGAGVRNEGLSHVVSDDDATEPGARYEIPACELDWFYGSPPLGRVSAIKIDVENHESAVLRGAMNLIARDRPLIYCELWGGENKREVFEMLEGLDYEAWVSVRGKLERYSGQPKTNFLFVYGGMSFSHRARLLEAM
jgi:FkbM family methyltransferase